MPTPVKAKAKWRRTVFKPSVKKGAGHVVLSTQVPVKTFGESVNMLQGDDGSGGLVDMVEDSDELQETASDDSADYIYSGNNGLASTEEDKPLVPDLFTSLPLIKDVLETETSVQQDYTVQECLPFLAGLQGCGRSLSDYNEHGLPRLDRDKHIRYLHDSFNKLPAGFAAYDASRPWLLYWALTGLSILGENVEQYRQRWYIEDQQRT